MTFLNRQELIRMDKWIKHDSRIFNSDLQQFSFSTYHTNISDQSYDSMSLLHIHYLWFSISWYSGELCFTRELLFDATPWFSSRSRKMLNSEHVASREFCSQTYLLLLRGIENEKPPPMESKDLTKARPHVVWTALQSCLQTPPFLVGYTIRIPSLEPVATEKCSEWIFEGEVCVNCIFELTSLFFFRIVFLLETNNMGFRCCHKISLLKIKVVDT